MSPIGGVDPTTISTVDGEHRVQIGLIDAICKAVEAGKSADEVGAIIKQLVDYSDVHFMSEELLMRLDSYDDFAEHIAEHGRMMDSLKEMAQTHKDGKLVLIPGQARSSLAFLLNHIETRDRRYLTWTAV